MSKPFDEETRRQARRLAAIQRNTLREILRQLNTAQAIVVSQLVGASPTALVKLRQQKVEIAAAIERFTDAGDAAVQAGLGASWQAGVDLVAQPLVHAGLAVSPVLRIDGRALLAMRSFMTGRIKDIGVQAVDRLNGVLAQVLIGTTPMHDAITEVQRILGGSTRQRAMTIAYTEVGRAHSVASQAAMLEAERNGVKIAKRWLKSGKQHPRPSHVDAHNQIVRVSEPFLIVSRKTGEVEELRYPRDPEASAANTINCGCLAIPVVDGSSYGAGVVVIPDDPKQKPRVVSRAKRDAENRAVVDRVNDRLARFLGEDLGDTSGLKVTR